MVPDVLYIQLMTLYGKPMLSKMLSSSSGGITHRIEASTKSPIFTVPEGTTWFCWANAVTTSAGDSPFDCSKRLFKLTVTWAYLPP
jgi:hypothetical protein